MGDHTRNSRAAIFFFLFTFFLFLFFFAKSVCRVSENKKVDAQSRKHVREAYGFTWYGILKLIYVMVYHKGARAHEVGVLFVFIDMA